MAEWIRAKTGREVLPQRGWEYLERLGFGLQKPRPRHAQARAEAQAEFNKNSYWPPS